jgi:hypothetical protein
VQEKFLTGKNEGQNREGCPVYCQKEMAETAPLGLQLDGLEAGCSEAVRPLHDIARRRRVVGVAPPTLTFSSGIRRRAAARCHVRGGGIEPVSGSPKPTQYVQSTRPHHRGVDRARFRAGTALTGALGRLRRRVPIRMSTSTYF